MKLMQRIPIHRRYVYLYNIFYKDIQKSWDNAQWHTFGAKVGVVWEEGEGQLPDFGPMSSVSGARQSQLN
jgi:hypothetical protein